MAFGLLCTSCKSKKTLVPRYIVLSPTEVEAKQKSRAYDIGTRILSTCNSSRFKPFTAAEATEAVRKNATPERLTRTCQKFLVKYGRFKDITLVEVLSFKKERKTVYRYKADYQWNHTLKELRVTLNEENQVSAINTRDWIDAFRL